MDYTQYYYANNGEKLKKMIDKILLNFGGIYDKDKDDFYSIGNEVFVSVLKSYRDGAQSFGTYLRNCIANKIKTEISRRNAMKRRGETESLDNDDNPIDIVSDVDFEEDFLSQESAKKMFESLSKTGQKIIRLRLQGKSDVEIKNELGLANHQFEDELRKAQARVKNIVPVKKKTITKTEKNIEGREEKTMSIAPDYRDDYLSLDLLKEKIDEGELLINHPNQRNDWAWSNDDISTLIATNLHGFRINPIIVCEETLDDGTLLNWIVDGKQRVTAMINFAYPSEYDKPFKISKKTEYAEISYQSKVTDENGNIMKDEVGRPILETKVFDIRNKTFAEFPEELQRRFKSYVFTVTRYVNCDCDMISYHIRRYNKGKAMNGTEKATTYLNVKNAALCKKVASNKFFDEVPFSAKGLKGGSACKCVMDSIFTINYRENWVKDLNKMYSFYNENGDPSDFELVDEYLTRISDVIDEEVAELFTPRDAHLFIGIFHSFVESGKEDWEFNEFLHDFIDGLREKNVGDITFDNIEVEGDKPGSKNRSTRDRFYIVTKMNILEELLNEWCGKGVAA